MKEISSMGYMIHSKQEQEKDTPYKVDWMSISSPFPFLLGRGGGVGVLEVK